MPCQNLITIKRNQNQNWKQNFLLKKTYGRRYNILTHPVQRSEAGSNIDTDYNYHSTFRNHSIYERKITFPGTSKYAYELSPGGNALGERNDMSLP